VAENEAAAAERVASERAKTAATHERMAEWARENMSEGGFRPVSRAQAGGLVPDRPSALSRSPFRRDVKAGEWRLGAMPRASSPPEGFGTRCKRCLAPTLAAQSCRRVNHLTRMAKGSRFADSPSDSYWDGYLLCPGAEPDLPGLLA
jgi:hypothetical protein